MKLQSLVSRGDAQEGGATIGGAGTGERGAREWGFGLVEEASGRGKPEPDNERLAQALSAGGSERQRVKTTTTGGVESGGSMVVRGPT